ncbi:MAG: hypothetical protein AMQ74_01922 [Candidatus Methanofastidiosum methylothiophilum]|uniref:Uncharacterized protein n=1 Tax=Candidatus Methanofastidiosum methylothiophilum TaxID=1705564 RepID=A0A150IJ53_9EURY|nr:MAG: hypothetical protein AMQ74_01922 [Candidatus Methanofastidiosum methylthiophilus]
MLLGFSSKFASSISGGHYATYASTGIEGEMILNPYWVQDKPMSWGGTSPAGSEKGYLDFNISFAFEVPIGFTTGIMMNSASTHLYFGSGVVGPPGPSCSLTWSDNQITEGWNSAVQLQGGFAYQKGISQNLSTFTEKGMGYPYGISITTFYVSPPLPSPPAPTPSNRKFYMHGKQSI